VALRTLRDPVVALRSQFPMLALMVGYTVISLWILTQPLVQGRGGEIAAAPARLPDNSVATFAAPVAAANQTPEHLHQLLAAIAPLQADSPNPSRWSMEPEVKSGVLCYCLHKAPDTIRALRQIGEKQFAQGLAALREQRYAEAIAALSRAIQLNPRDVRAYVNRGLAYGHMRAYAQAHDDFTRALEWAPQQAEASYARRVTDLLLKRVAQAQ
jgi:tetratricopeptide (TPR) repeat protein